MIRPQVDAAHSIYAGTFEQFLDAMPDGVVVARVDGQIMLANRQAESLSGYSREELVGMTVEELVPEGLRSQHVHHRRSYQDRPAARSMGSLLDIRFRRKDGTEFPADIALSPVETERGILVVASVRDRTDRKLAEEQLLEAQERFRLVLEGVRDYAIFMLDREGHVRTWNSGAERIKGYTAEEILGKHFSVFYLQADAAAGKPERELAEATARGRYEEESWRVRKDGRQFWASVVITALYDEAGKLQGFAKITRDVTERKRLDDRLRALLEVAQSILEGHDDEAVLRLIASRARALLGADLAAVALADPEDGSFVVRTADGDRSAAIRGLREPAGGTLTGSVVAPGRPAVLTDAATEATLARPLLDAAGAGPALVLPLASGGRRFGVLTVANDPGGPRFTDSDLGLVQLFAAQAAVAIDYARVRDELQRLAVLGDRERIGRELHDGAIQALFAVGMGLQGMAMMTEDAGLRERLESSVRQIDDVIRDLRNYIFGLRPGLAADRHIGHALQELAEQFEEHHGVACAVDVDHELASRLAGQAADLIQLAREALTNVGKHAAATTCRVSLRGEPGRAVMEIEDDGRGFVAGEAEGKGWGLRNLEERAAALGGGLVITSVAGEGTRVRLTIPV
jgi:PAS domain S-box-containing protein